MKKILVTGGAGFIGSNLINKLINEDNEIICVDNLFTGNKKNIYTFLDKPNFTFILHDVTFPLYLEVDEIYHLACPASPVHYQRNPVQTTKTCVMGTINMLGLAKRTKAKILQASTSEIYGDPDNKNVPTKENYRGNVNSMGPRACYDESKRLGETLCYIYSNYFNVHTNIIRPFNVYGPGMRQNDYRIFPNFISNILNNKALRIYGTGNQTRTYCYISDAIEGFLRVTALGKSGEAYNIGNTKPEISVKEIVKIFKNLAKNKIKSKIIKYPSSYPKDEPQRRSPNINKAIKDLKYKPKVTLQKGLKNYLLWATENYKF